jgi:hypothetical protein
MSCVPPCPQPLVAAKGKGAAGCASCVAMLHSCSAMRNTMNVADVRSVSDVTFGFALLMGLAIALMLFRFMIF